MTPLISVITVTYNAGNLIGRTLDSLKNQSFKDFEHLVIDGNSNDDTLMKVREANLPQSFVVSEPDHGLYDAMNKGLNIAKGKYVIFLNAGDVFHDETILASYANHAENNADIIYGDTDIVDNSGNKISNRHLSVPNKLTKDSFADGMLICHQAFMVRKNLTQKFDLSYRFSSDYDWCIKCINNSSTEKCINLKRVTIDYLNDGLTDKNKLRSLKERFIVMRNHFGLSKTLRKHLGFIFRAIRRGKL